MYGVSTQNGSFGRTNANTKVMGAYYTRLEEMHSAKGLFKFPEGKEVCVLEPSIGDGSAVKAITDRANNENVKIFGVELNDNVAQQTKKDPLIEDCLSADFTNGVVIKNNAFSFIFGNPPYMDDDDTDDGKRDRLERTFLERVTGSYLKKDGILVWVIPYSRFLEYATIKYMIGHYETLHVWKFRGSEYEKWHQVLIVARKTATKIALTDQIAAYHDKYADDTKIPELPLTFEGTELYQSIEVYPSESSEITLFATKEFHPLEAYQFLSIKADLDDYKKLAGKRATQKEYASSDLGKPPIPLKKDSEYLMITAGVGQGFAGTRGKDLHLQRGVAEVIEEAEYKSGDGANASDNGTIAVTTRAKVTMSIIETDGTITVLE
ncbi:DUF6094 domain-containing protein [Butyrivibrio hungatei]|uniref:DUF6094 domain-containing protein n=1 Tax=Butyrivibrio hungatei TaxID=185008 RepID=A0A1D9P5G8_9FIRM|nr:DUF6094 domain-containing protein [Butyrivibrio hungatei]AOZ97827.1 hypothetical protein bhn_II028 [Butyrivibrio hungatei]